MELARPFETCLNVSTVKLCVYLKYFQDLVSFHGIKRMILVVPRKSN